MENTAPTRIGHKRKASVRNRGTPAKKKHEGTKKVQVRRCLNKSAKQGVFTALKKAISSPNSLDQADSGGELLATVLQEVDSQLYIHTFPCRAEFWEKFKVTDLMAGICEALGELYCTTYKECDSGKEKYANFQLEWYRKCSLLLLENPAEASNPLYSQWYSYRANHSNQCSVYHSNAVLIGIQSAVYNYLNKVTASTVGDLPCDNAVKDAPGIGTAEASVEPEDVYYRFGGAAIAEMLHNRYKRIHSCPMDKRSSVVEEISILKAIQTMDKSHVPASLQYRDRGFMYFPDRPFLPFIKAVDQTVKSIANEDGIKHHGKHIVEVATQKVRSDDKLRRSFTDALVTKFDSLQGLSSAVDAVYAELLRKLCNTRLGEFMDSFRQIQISKSGTATLSGQNLRDSLLSQHVNMKTQYSNMH